MAAERAICFRIKVPCEGFCHMEVGHLLEHPGGISLWWLSCTSAGDRHQNASKQKKLHQRCHFFPPEISRNLLIFSYDLYQFFFQYKTSLLNFLHRSSEANLDNTKATLIQGDLLPSQLLSQSCCHDEIRLHSRGQMSNARESEH